MGDLVGADVNFVPDSAGHNDYFSPAYIFAIRGCLF
jgi:hypothetical protein